MPLKKNIVVYNPVRFAGEVWLPQLWAQAKTYYERHGHKINSWNWQPCHADIWADDYSRIREVLEDLQPDVFALSLYVWNCRIGHEVAAWVKQRWPHCLVVTGGPHQYFKHDDNWFRQHPYIDASLPGECYGELAIQEILDNIDDQGQINWDRVSDVCYPIGRSRTPAYSKKSIYQVGKKTFDYNWSAFSNQIEELRRFMAYTKQHFEKAKFLSIFETTRGCPYGCTYCDWGGGINSQVLKKSLECVYQDIDAICTMDLKYLYFADANFGIFGERDLGIIRYLAEKRLQNDKNFPVGYGGFAKTTNKLSYIRDILEVDVTYGLSILGEIKVSLQSLDEDVLKRIDRKNVSLDQQITMFSSIPALKKLPIYVELIQGLPGMTLEKFYHELDVLGGKDLSIQWYPWILLPEAPAYSREYRSAQGLKTVTKNAGWWTYENDNNNLNEIVIGALTYSTDDYLEMLLASGLYKLFVQGGYFFNTRKWLQSKGINLGQLISRLYQEFLPQTGFLDTVNHRWHEAILQDSESGCTVDIEGHNVYLGLYFPAVAFTYPEKFTHGIVSWLKSTFDCPEDILEKDLMLTINKHNFGKTKISGLYQFDYRRAFYRYPDNLEKVLLQFLQFKNSGHIMQAKKKLLGIF